jgi:hypothetical protein
MLLVTLMTLTQETWLSAVPDRPACYPTRAAPICRDALLGGLINISYSLSVGYLQIAFVGSCFGATETRTGRAASWASKTAQPRCQADVCTRRPHSWRPIK